MSNLRAKLEAAYAGSEDSNEGNYKQFESGYDEGMNVSDEQYAQIPPQRNDKVETEDSFDPFGDNSDFSEAQRMDTPSYEQSQQTPSYEQPSYQAPSYEQPSYQTPSYEQTSYEENPFEDSSIRESALTKEKVVSIIGVYQEWNKLDPTKRKALNSLLKVDSNDPGEIIYAISQINKEIIESMSLLIKLHKEEPVARAFELMAMKNEEVYSLAELVASIDEGKTVNIKIEENRIEYCRQLERNISGLSSAVMDNLRPLGNVLYKAVALSTP